MQKNGLLSAIDAMSQIGGSVYFYPARENYGIILSASAGLLQEAFLSQRAILSAVSGNPSAL